MSYKIDKTFPVKLGDVTTITGLTLDAKASTFDSRLKRIFRKVFYGVSYDEDYWKLLKDMVSNPNDDFGLVAIDGYYTDVMGKDDLALVFNMGVPKLRGRKVYYLDRVFVRIASGNNLKFYNSLNSHFDFDDRIVAWHPHISSGEACLGSYTNDLARWKEKGNPIMYLKTIHQFLNTWNVRSPFWNINNTTIDHIECPKKPFKSSKIISATAKIGISYTKTIEKYIIDNISKINTGSIANDIYCLVVIYNKEKKIKSSMVDDFKHFFNKDMLNYLRSHHREHSGDDPRNTYENSIITRGTRIMIPKQIINDGISKTTFDMKSIGHGGLTNNDQYNSKRIILEALSRIVYDLYMWVTSTSPIDGIFENDEYVLSMKCKYQFPLIAKNYVHFDKMTLSGLYDHRVHSFTSESSSVNPEYYSKKHKLVKKYEQRVLRLDRLYLAHYRNKLDKKSVNNIVNNKLKDYFYYKINRKDPFTKRNSGEKPRILHYLISPGMFWKGIGIHSTDGMFQEVAQFVKDTKCNKGIVPLVNAFEAIKRELILEESNSLINQYDIIIRRLKEYGYKTSDTKKDTQQIHLSFE